MNKKIFISCYDDDLTQLVDWLSKQMRKNPDIPYKIEVIIDEYNNNNDDDDE
jgi:hypothetical protein